MTGHEPGKDRDDRAAGQPGSRATGQPGNRNPIATTASCFCWEGFSVGTPHALSLRRSYPKWRGSFWKPIAAVPFRPKVRLSAGSCDVPNVGSSATNERPAAPRFLSTPSPIDGRVPWTPHACARLRKTSARSLRRGHPTSLPFFSTWPRTGLDFAKPRQHGSRKSDPATRPDVFGARCVPRFWNPSDGVPPHELRRENQRFFVPARHPSVEKGRGPSVHEPPSR